MIQIVISIAWVVIIVLAELFTPKWAAVLIALANIFIPDMVPFIDEILGVIIAAKRILGNE